MGVHFHTLTVSLCSLCHLQLPESVLRVPGRRERHHGRDQREADRVRPGFTSVDSMHGRCSVVDLF